MQMKSGPSRSSRRGWSKVAAAGALLALAASACSADTAGSGESPSAAPVRESSRTEDSSAAEAAIEEMIPVGVSLELSGVQAAVGQRMERGIELASEVVNRTGFTVDGTTYGFDLRIEDNKSDPQQAVVLNQQFQQDGVKFILGPSNSLAWAPAHNVMAGYDYLGITTAVASVPVLGTDEGPYLWDAVTLAHTETGSIVRLIEERFAPKKVAILMAQDPNGELFLEAYQDGFASNSAAEIVYQEYFPPETTDFSSYITRIKQAEPDLVVIGWLNTRVAPFIQQATTAGLNPAVFVSAPGGDNGAIEGIEDQVDNYVWSVGTRSVETDDPAIANYRELFADAYGNDPSGADFWGLAFYDPILMLAEAMERAGTVEDVAAISESLSEVDEWPQPAMPDRRFDPETHVAEYAPQIGVFSDGEISYVLSDQ